MDLFTRQINNMWKKKTYDVDKEDFFRRAPKKLKDRTKRMIIKGEYNKNGWLPSSLYECYGVNISTKVCNELIDHYRKGERNEERI